MPSVALAGRRRRRRGELGGALLGALIDPVSLVSYAVSSLIRPGLSSDRAPSLPEGVVRGPFALGLPRRQPSLGWRRPGPPCCRGEEDRKPAHRERQREALGRLTGALRRPPDPALLRPPVTPCDRSRSGHAILAARWSAPARACHRSQGRCWSTPALGRAADVVR